MVMYATNKIYSEVTVWMQPCSEANSRSAITMLTTVLNPAKKKSF
jgi:hypothetical protein